MTTYTITYWPPAGAPAATTTVQAADFLLDGAFVIFTDTNEHAVLAVPQALNPVITQTST